MKKSEVSSLDLKLASAVQDALLNSQVPQCRCGKMVLKNRMCSTIGGDFYHFRKLHDDQVAFAIGDVMGHNVSSALVMTMIMGLLQADRVDNRRPNRVAGTINDELVNLGEQVGEPITCSLIYGVVDLPSGILLYVNAGHPHPIIFNRIKHHIAELAPTTMLLGVQRGLLPESCHQFVRGDRLVLFTDGIIEAGNLARDRFGKERLSRTIIKTGEQDPQILTDELFGELEKFCENRPPEDDQTTVVIDFDAIQYQ